MYSLLRKGNLSWHKGPLPTFHTLGQKSIIFLINNYRYQAIDIDKTRFKAIIFEVMSEISSLDLPRCQEIPKIRINGYRNFPAYF